jgi:hypothetical protein
MFECTNTDCGFRRHVDAVAGFNMLIDGCGLGPDGVSGPGEEALEKNREMLRVVDRLEGRLQALACASRRVEKAAE